MPHMRRMLAPRRSGPPAAERRVRATGEELALGALDAVLASSLTAGAVDRIARSPLIQRAVSGLDQGPLVDAIAAALIRDAVLERLSTEIVRGASRSASPRGSSRRALWSVGRPLAVRPRARDGGHARAEDPGVERLIVKTLDSERAEVLVGVVADSPGMERMVGRAIDSRLLDTSMARLLASEELWDMVYEIAQSPAVSDAIAHQGISFAARWPARCGRATRRIDVRLARAARRPSAGARNPAPTYPVAPPLPDAVHVAAPVAPRYTGLVTRAIALAIDAALINVVAAAVGFVIALSSRRCPPAATPRTSSPRSPRSSTCSGRARTSSRSGARPGRRRART